MGKTNNNQKMTKKQRTLSKTLWLISTARNAIVVILCATIAYCYESFGNGSPVILTGTVKPGLPSVNVPPFSTSINNVTIPFSVMFSDLGSSVILVPIIAVLGNVAIAKAFGKLTLIN